MTSLFYTNENMTGAAFLAFVCLFVKKEDEAAGRRVNWHNLEINKTARHLLRTALESAKSAKLVTLSLTRGPGGRGPVLVHHYYHCKCFEKGSKIFDVFVRFE